jgi:hypothetical protein
MSPIYPVQPGRDGDQYIQWINTSGQSTLDAIYGKEIHTCADYQNFINFKKCDKHEIYFAPRVTETGEHHFINPSTI